MSLHRDVCIPSAPESCRADETLASTKKGAICRQRFTALDTLSLHDRGVSKATHLKIISFGEGRGQVVGLAMQESSELDPEYRRISRERNRVAATKTRTAQVIDSRSVNAKTAYTQTYANKCKVQCFNIPAAFCWLT